MRIRLDRTAEDIEGQSAVPKAKDKGREFRPLTGERIFSVFRSRLAEQPNCALIFPQAVERNRGLQLHRNLSRGGLGP